MAEMRPDGEQGVKAGEISVEQRQQRPIARESDILALECCWCNAGPDWPMAGPPRDERTTRAQQKLDICLSARMSTSGHPNGRVLEFGDSGILEAFHRARVRLQPPQLPASSRPGQSTSCRDCECC